jgi:Na+/proline symporter
MKLTGIKGAITGAIVVSLIFWWATRNSSPLTQAICFFLGFVIGFAVSLIFLWIDKLRKPPTAKDMMAGMMGPRKPKPKPPQN